MEHLTLAGAQSAHALRAVIDQRLPALVVERLPVHADGGQRRVVVAVHQLLDEAWRAVLAQFEAHDGVHVVLGVEETLVEVQLVAERIAARVVGLLEEAAPVGQQALARLVNEGVVRQAHLVGGGLVVLLAARLPPLILEHDVILEPLQELGL